MRQVAVQRNSGKKWCSTGNGAWGGRSGHEADVGLGKDIVVIIGKVKAPFGVRWRKCAIEAEAAIVLEVADVSRGVAVFQNTDRCAQRYPLLRLVVGADAVVLKMTGRNPRKGIISRQEFDIGADAEIVRWPRSESDQTSMAVNQCGISIKIIGAGCANPLRVHRLAGAGTASGKRREENQVLTVCNGMSDLTALIAITHVAGDPFREIVLQQKGVHPPGLPQKLSQGVRDEVSRRTADVLRASGRGEGRRACCRRKHVRGSRQIRGDKVVSNKRPGTGNAEVVVAEAVHDTELVRHADSDGKIAGQGKTMG